VLRHVGVRFHDPRFSLFEIRARFSNFAVHPNLFFRRRENLQIFQISMIP
jgi:hypothetical protein